MRSEGTITLREVALRAGVSKTTAGHVLNARPDFQVQEATRHRVFEAARFLGYRRNALAAALSGGRLHTVGVVLPHRLFRTGNAAHRLYAQNMALAVTEAAAAQGLRITLIPLPDTGPAHAAEIADRRVDGLILVSLGDFGLIRALRESGIPCVEIGSSESEIWAVNADNEGGAFAAVEHLADLGHRRILHYHAPLEGFTARRRIAGYREGCAHRGLAPWEVLGYTAMRDALGLPSHLRPSAVFTYNDAYACAVLDAAAAEGLRVPLDLSVVGFDNNILAQSARPRLSTVDYPLLRLAEGALALLGRGWRGEEAQEQGNFSADAPIPTPLVVRESSGPAPP